MTEADANSHDHVAKHVAQSLKVAFDAVATSPLPPTDKGRWQHRLIAITNMTKRDVARARDQLQRFVDEWNALGAGKEIQQ